MNETRKKILYVITKSNFGGAQRYVFELATSLPKDQYDVAVACGGNGILTEKLHAAGIPVYTIKNFERDIDIWKEIKSLFELKKIIHTMRPDIVHLNSSKAGGSGAFVARIMHVPHIVFTAHGWPFHEQRGVIWRTLVWILSWITTLLAHTVIVVSRYDMTHAHMPFTRRKIHHIPTALPPITFTERTTTRRELFNEETLKLHAHDLFAVSTGEHTPNKNLQSLLWAVKTHNETQTQKIFLTLMSDGEERPLLEAYVRANHMEDMVHFTGFVDNARTYLKAFDMFVLPSLKEGMPYGLLEAGAAGLAAIASNVGGIPEIIEHGVHGLLIEPNTISSISTALATLGADPQLRTKFGQSLETKILTQFTLNSMLEKTTKLYEDFVLRKKL